MRIPEINAKTMQHGIKTLDQDRYSHQSKEDPFEGLVIVAKISFNKNRFATPGDCQRSQEKQLQNYSKYDLTTMSVNAIADLFVQIVQSHQHQQIEGSSFRARNVLVQNGIGPHTLLFVLGHKDS